MIKNIHKSVLFFFHKSALFSFFLKEEKHMYGYTTPGKVFLIEQFLSFNTEISYNLRIPLKIVFFSECVHRKNVYIHPQHKVKHCKHNVVWEVPSCSPPGTESQRGVLNHTLGSNKEVQFGCWWSEQKPCYCTQSNYVFAIILPGESEAVLVTLHPNMIMCYLYTIIFIVLLLCFRELGWWCWCVMHNFSWRKLMKNRLMVTVLGEHLNFRLDHWF